MENENTEIQPKKTKITGTARDLKKVRRFMKRGSGKIQLTILKDRIEKMADAGASMVAMHKYFSAEGLFVGSYPTFIKNLKENFPEIYQIYARQK